MSTAFMSRGTTARLGISAFLWALMTLALGGCTNLFYNQVKPGYLSGTLVVEWYETDKFLIVPDPQSPLTFTRFNGEQIRPNIMLVDGRALPRKLWVAKHYTPWGYTPAFVIHDWLQHIHRCGMIAERYYGQEETTRIMTEVIKTLMNDPLYGGPNQSMLYSLYQAVTTPAADRVWWRGECLQPTDLPATAEPIARYSIHF